jgi:hypothetical protein
LDFGRNASLFSLEDFETTGRIGGFFFSAGRQKAGTEAKGQGPNQQSLEGSWMAV